MQDILLSNEQKLDDIHRILLLQEKRRSRYVFYKTLKWFIILGAIYLVATHPEDVMTRVTEIVKPLVLSTASGLTESQKASLKDTYIKAINEKIPLNMK